MSKKVRISTIIGWSLESQPPNGNGDWNLLKTYFTNDTVIKKALNSCLEK